MNLFYRYTIIIAYFLLNASYAQNYSVLDSIDSKYREDQFYISVSYNILNNKPEDVKQNGFSTAINFGFIRDFPVNKKRNKAIGLGFGLSFNSYFQNLAITKSDNNVTSFSITDSDFSNVNKNRFNTVGLELPLEFRWRTSNATEHNFWRIYGGFKLSYILSNSSVIESSEFSEKLSNISEFNTLQYGLTLSAGYGTWNFHLYYGLNPIFENSELTSGEVLDMSTIKLGLIFYIL